MNPGRTFCSRIRVGIRSQEARRTIGPELYPPTPTTSRGREPDEQREGSEEGAGKEDEAAQAPRARGPSGPRSASGTNADFVAGHDRPLGFAAAPDERQGEVRDPSRRASGRGRGRGRGGLPFRRR